MTPPTSAGSAPGGLRSSVLSGGLFLMGRQAVSIAFKLVGVLLISRVLGPERYGSFAAAFGIYRYAVSLGQVGLGVGLLRREGSLDRARLGTATTILTGMAAILVAAIELGAGPLSSFVNVEGFAEVIQILVLAIPFLLLTLPAMVGLERALDYRSVALVEMASQAVYYAVAVPLVLLGHGAPALAVAWLVQVLCGFVLAHWRARMVPVFLFDRRIARELVVYAAGFSLQNWIWQMRQLAVPLVVGPLLGAHAAGIVGMTVGILEMLTVLKNIAWRLALASLARIQRDLDRLRKAIDDGIELQTLAIGTVLLGFSWFGQWIVPNVFGARWMPVLDVYPLVAVGYLTAASFNMHSSTLSMLDRNLRLVGPFIVHVALFLGGVALGISQFGVGGYGMGEIAALPSYVLVHLALARAIGSPRYRVAGLWWGATVVGLFWRDLGAWAIAVPFLALAAPPSLRRLRAYAGMIGFGRPPTASSA